MLSQDESDIRKQALDCGYKDLGDGEGCERAVTLCCFSFLITHDSTSNYTRACENLMLEAFGFVVNL